VFIQVIYEFHILSTSLQVIIVCRVYWSHVVCFTASNVLFSVAILAFLILVRGKKLIIFFCLHSCFSSTPFSRISTW